MSRFGVSQLDSVGGSERAVLAGRSLIASVATKKPFRRVAKKPRGRSHLDSVDGSLPTSRNLRASVATALAYLCAALVQLGITTCSCVSMTAQQRAEVGSKKFFFFKKKKAH